MTIQNKPVAPHPSQASPPSLGDRDITPARRGFLLSLGGIGLGLLAHCGGSGNGAGGGSGGTADGGGGSTAGDASTSGGDAGGAASGDAGGVEASDGSASATVDASSCTLTVEQEEGPYYVPIELIRSDITDGREGLPLAITFTILNATTCLPLANAAIDVWHCDYTGVYSDEESEGTLGETYHRGVQITNAAGQVTFKTFYPGWYNGRTVHFHLKVHVGGTAAAASGDAGATYGGGHVSHTGNVFFPQAINDAVAAIAPYVTGDTNSPRTTNVEDNVWANQGGSAYVCTMSGNTTSGYTATITLCVDPTATPCLIGVTSSGIDAGSPVCAGGGGGGFPGGGP